MQLDMASILPALHRAAPRLTRQFFQCSYHRPNSSLLCPSAQKVTTELRSSRTFQTRPSLFSSAAAIATGSESQASSPLSSLSQAVKAKRTHPKRPFFPETSSKATAYWLLGSAASVFGIVVFGGLTRLTESGLSITEWKPVTGSLPPSNEDQWLSEFQKYQSSPEFKLLNPNITMAEFKKIYYMEWTHRLWGRVVGISFVLPAVYLIVRRRVSKPMTFRIMGIGGLVGFQGLLGWWMVKSGLKDDLFAPGSHPRVSQYRLVAHLGTAFFCYSAMLWSGLEILREQKLLANLERARYALQRLQNPKLRTFRTAIAALAGLVFFTAMSGGFVAGLDAGLIYNNFPWMGQDWLPPKDELLSDFYSKKADGRDLWWRNAFENPSLAQLDHRILATTTFSAVVALFAYSRFLKAKKVLPFASGKAMHGVLGFACLQVALGISTLVYLVPVPLASAHQAGSLALLSYVLILASRTWIPSPRISALLAKRIAKFGSTPTKKASPPRKFKAKVSAPRQKPEVPRT